MRMGDKVTLSEMRMRRVIVTMIVKASELRVDRAVDHVVNFTHFVRKSLLMNSVVRESLFCDFSLVT